MEAAQGRDLIVPWEECEAASSPSWGAHLDHPPSLVFGGDAYDDCGGHARQ